jgi:hypothetical protein
MRSVLIGTTFTVIISVSTEANVSEATRVSVNGIGSIRIGMSVSEAARASGLELVPEHEPLASDELDCYYVKPRAGLTGVTFMIRSAHVARIDISNPRVRTVSGAGVGSTESDLRRLYAGRVNTTKHKYDPTGHYMVVHPRGSRQIVFETDGRVVTEYRVGKVPEVGYVEGCL